MSHASSLHARQWAAVMIHAVVGGGWGYGAKRGSARERVGAGPVGNFDMPFSLEQNPLRESQHRSALVRCV